MIRDLFDLTLTWPDGTRMKRVTFDRKVAQDRLLDHVSLGDERIRDLVQRLPRAIPSQPIARVSLPDFPSEIVGFWSLWRIVLDPDSWRDVKILPLFLHDDGRILVPTARRIWDCLLEDRPAVNQLGSMPDEGVAEIFRSLRLEAERQGQAAFDELLGPAPAAAQAGAGQEPVYVPGAPGCARTASDCPRSVSIGSASWRKSRKPGRPSFAGVSGFCPNSSP